MINHAICTCILFVCFYCTLMSTLLSVFGEFKAASASAPPFLQVLLTRSFNVSCVSNSSNVAPRLVRPLCLKLPVPLTSSSILDGTTCVPLAVRRKVVNGKDEASASKTGKAVVDLQVRLPSHFLAMSSSKAPSCAPTITAGPSVAANTRASCILPHLGIGAKSNKCSMLLSVPRLQRRQLESCAFDRHCKEKLGELFSSKQSGATSNNMATMVIAKATATGKGMQFLSPVTLTRTDSCLARVM